MSKIKHASMNICDEQNIYIYIYIYIHRYRVGKKRISKRVILKTYLHE